MTSEGSSLEARTSRRVSSSMPSKVCLSPMTNPGRTGSHRREIVRLGTDGSASSHPILESDENALIVWRLWWTRIPSMWTVDDKMQAFNALPYGDKWRVCRRLTRGVAPNDPRMAAAAVELAESYGHRSRATVEFMRWAPVFIIACAGCLVISAADRGNQAMLIFNVLLILGWGTHFMFNPATRPKNVARSLEASRVVASRSVKA
jgi:hypothetical protein